MTDYRVCNTPDLRVLASKVGAGQMEPQVNATLDPDGVHVLEQTLYGHNMDAGHPLQHKVRVMAKTLGTDEPTTFTIVMTDADWRMLTTYEAAMAASK